MPALRRGACLLVLMAACVAASADEIRLRDGRTLRGKIVCQMQGLLYFRLPDELVYFPVADVVDIRPAPTRREQYRAAEAKLGFVDTAGRLALARWGIRAGLRKQPLATLDGLLVADPKNVAALALRKQLAAPRPTPPLALAPPPPIKVFNRRVRGMGIVFLLDQSGSMRERWSAIRERLALDLLGLSPRHTFNVILFSGSKRVMFSDGLRPGTEKNIMQAQAWLAKQRTRGVTHIKDAFDTAVEMKGCDRVVLMTDLETEGHEVDHIKTYIRKRLADSEFARLNPPIDVISLSDGHGDNTKLKGLVTLARKQPDASADKIE